MTAQMPPTPPAAKDLNDWRLDFAFSTVFSLSSSVLGRSCVEGIEEPLDDEEEGMASEVGTLEGSRGEN